MRSGSDSERHTAVYEGAEAAREGAADVLDRAASRADDAAAADGVTGLAAERAAAGMHTAAGYLKTHDTEEIIDEVEQYIRAHPMRSLATAVATGFLVGRVLR